MKPRERDASAQQIDTAVTNTAVTMCATERVSTMPVEEVEDPQTKETTYDNGHTVSFDLNSRLDSERLAQFEESSQDEELKCQDNI